MDSHSGSQAQQSLPPSPPVGEPHPRRLPGAGTRARNSMRLTAIRIACPWVAGPGRRSAGGTCNASIQRGDPWAPPPSGPQPSPAPPRWAPLFGPPDALLPVGCRRKTGRTLQRRRDLLRRVSPLGNTLWHRSKPTRNRSTWKCPSARAPWKWRALDARLQSQPKTPDRGPGP